MGIRRPVRHPWAACRGGVAVFRWWRPGLDGAVGRVDRRAGAVCSWSPRSARRRRGAAICRARPWPRRDHRVFGDATRLDRRVAQVRVTDPHHPLYGKCFPVSYRRSGRGPRVIVIRLPDGRERGIPRSATTPATVSDDLVPVPGSRQLHISVRTLLPLANHVGAVLASRHADLEGGGERDLVQSSANQAGCSATAVAAGTNGDTASTCTAGGATRAAPEAARSLRGEPSC